MKKMLILLTFIMTLISACGSKQNPAVIDNGQTPSASSNPIAAASPSPVPAPTVQPASPSPSPSTVQPSEAQAGKKLYHMNKNYDIVPNDATGKKNVALLTFDDGPKEKEMLESILDTLEKHKAKAIFFVNGYRVKQHPQLLKMIVERGHVPGNHSWEHIDLKKASKDKVSQQLSDVQNIIKEVTGQTPQFFRPPFGSGNDGVKQAAKDENMLYMTWSNGSKDWEMTTKNNDPNKIIQNVLDQLHPGSNILMHELPWTAQALDKLLTQIEEKGYSFVDPNSIELEMR